MQPHIEIRIQLDPYRSDSDERIVLPIDKYLVREAAQMLDFPKRGTDPLTEAIFCTPRVTRESVSEDRVALADAAARHVRAKLLEMLGSNDTENGYKRPALNTGSAP
jgi:hypothetical protein